MRSHTLATTREKKEDEEEEEGGGKEAKKRRRRSKLEEDDDDDDAMIEDDICFTHILPRLNGTDLKFLCEVNSETRALVKRSSRKRELKKRFKVSEMSSISTLEVCAGE